MLENTINIKKNYPKNSKKIRGKVAIRSSTIHEDSENKSMAGYFLSELNVKIDNSELLKKNIDKVIKSYSKFKSSKNEILVQEMVSDVKFLG